MWLEQNLAYKPSLYGWRYDVPYNPHSSDFFLDNDVRPLADELRRVLSELDHNEAALER